MQFIADFGLNREDLGPIPPEVLERLNDKWVEAVEKEGLCTGGGVREYTRLDLFLDMLWPLLWRFKLLHTPVGGPYD